MAKQELSVVDNSYICALCQEDKGTPKNFSTENNIDTRSDPLELSDLTQCEKLLIARVVTVMQVFVTKGQSTIS